MAEVSRRRAQERTGRPAFGGSPAHEPQGLYWDPFSILDALGYREKPTAVTFETLRTLPNRVPILGGMIFNATKTAPRVFRPAKDVHTGVGLVCCPKDWEPGDKLSSSDQKFADRLMRGLQAGTMAEDGRGYVKLPRLIEQLTWASYLYDQCCYEIIPDVNGRPLTWLPAPSASMRLANAPYTYPVAAMDDPEVPYVTQVYQGQIVRQYGFYEMAFAVRNPRCEIELGGYGTAEGEMTAHSLAMLLNADLYHSKIFGQGIHAKGILNVKGPSADPEKFNEFRRDIYLQVMGVKNAGVMPVTRAADGLEFIDLRMNAKEMEFGNLYDFEIKIVGAHMLMDPAEIHFRYGTVGQKGSLAQESNRERVIDSRARWLPPLSEFHAEHLTTYIVERLDPDWEVRVIGLDNQTKKEKAELMELKVRTTHKLDEARAEVGMDPVGPENGGDLILNPTYMQWLAGKQAAEQAEQQGGMPGEDGAPPGEGGEAGAGESGGGDEFEDLLSQLDQGGDEEGGGEGEAPQPKKKPAGALKKSRRFAVEV